MKNVGLPEVAFDSPVIGICNTLHGAVPIFAVSSSTSRLCIGGGELPLEFPVLLWGSQSSPDSYAVSQSGIEILIRPLSTADIQRAVAKTCRGW